jgi:DNA mismatch endonuclease, patch repair protein
MKEDPETRSRIMRAVKGKDTAPEMIVRRIVHSMGYRYRLHRQDLPGKPDLVFPRLGKIIFIHGCFWHGHDCTRGARMPRANHAYWQRKITLNSLRDENSIASLRSQGWRVEVIWECELKDIRRMRARLAKFLS